MLLLETTKLADQAGDLVHKGVSIILLTVAVLLAAAGIALWFIWKIRERKAAQNETEKEHCKQSAKFSLTSTWLCAVFILFLGSLMVGLVPEPWNSIVLITTATIITCVFIYAAFKTKGFKNQWLKDTDETEKDTENQ